MSSDCEGKPAAMSTSNPASETHTLVLVRHGQSEWNRLNLFTGWRDPDLTEKGVIEARWAGRVLRDFGIRFDHAFTSRLRRAQNTLDIILDVMGQSGVPIERDEALNERDYGQLSGLNKDEARQRFGEDMVMRWRRSYDVPPPGGESLKDTAARVLPYYEAHIWPVVASGKKVIVAAHGNSLRALIMRLEGLSGEQIIQRELATGAPIVYVLDTTGAVVNRTDLVTSEGRDNGIG
jgi:2,3-bisphosphoglycerate-dependent phosphoglycerate mutase